jgi:hypothetical protein
MQAVQLLPTPALPVRPASRAGERPAGKVIQDELECRIRGRVPGPHLDILKGDS